jgi:hypothetical protein
VQAVYNLQHNYQINYPQEEVQSTGAISMRRRQALIIELQERVRIIQTEIERDQEKVEEIEYIISIENKKTWSFISPYYTS